MLSHCFDPIPVNESFDKSWNQNCYGLKKSRLNKVNEKKHANKLTGITTLKNAICVRSHKRREGPVKYDAIFSGFFFFLLKRM